MMTHPAEYLVSMAKANGQLALKFGEIARSGGSECFRLASSGASSGAGPSALAADGGARVAGGFAALEKIRSTAAGRVEEALAEWRDVWLAAAAGSTNISQAFRPFAPRAGATDTPSAIQPGS